MLSQADQPPLSLPLRYPPLWQTACGEVAKQRSAMRAAGYLGYLAACPVVQYFWPRLECGGLKILMAKIETMPALAHELITSDVTSAPERNSLGVVVSLRSWLGGLRQPKCSRPSDDMDGEWVTYLQ